MSILVSTVRYVVGNTLDARSASLHRHYLSSKIVITHGVGCICTVDHEVLAKIDLGAGHQFLGVLVAITTTSGTSPEAVTEVGSAVSQAID